MPTDPEQLRRQQALVRALQNPAAYPHPVDAVELVETHISWVLLAGDYAYKIKKAVDLGFLDFSTLERRRHFCLEELRLNTRLAPDLYLGLVTLTGRWHRPRLCRNGPVLEFAVRMRRFDQQALLLNMLAAGRLGVRHVDAVADCVADFHARIAVAPPDSPWGTPGAVWQPVAENFAHLEGVQADPATARTLARLRHWSREEWQRLQPEFERRHRGGHVRECHGDLHLGNIAWIGDRPVPFDGIEFDPGLYWIDTMSEVAFLHMDLCDHDREPLAWRFTDRYLSRTGDYAGLRVFRYYLCYRAMVRAKVAAIRAGQAPDPEQATAGRREFEAYVGLADRLARRGRGCILLTHGLSGSGKSTWTADLVGPLRAVRIRSDRERKRLFPSPPDAPGGDLYSAGATRRTYARLADLGREIAAAGWTVIVDAAALRRWQRDLLREAARAAGAGFAILWFRASPESLRARVRARQAAGRDISDADLRVLEAQLAAYAPPAPEEMGAVLEIDTETCGPGQADALARRIRARCADKKNLPLREDKGGRNEETG